MRLDREESVVHFKLTFNTNNKFARKERGDRGGAENGRKAEVSR